MHIQGDVFTQNTPHFNNYFQGGYLKKSDLGIWLTFFFRTGIFRLVKFVGQLRATLTPVENRLFVTSGEMSPLNQSSQGGPYHFRKSEIGRMPKSQKVDFCSG
jgi:hypothetical protein